MMSPNKSRKGAVAVRDSSPEPGPSSSKRAKRSKMSSDDEEDSVPKSKKAAPSKFVSKSKRSPGFTAHNKPAELFRKDLISAMKLPDSEPLQEGSYFLISDPWRQEWEKGVQVPVNMKEIAQTDIREMREKSKTGDFKIPHKLLHERVDSGYKKGMHELTGMQQLAEQLVRYDLDDLDVCWLEEVNFKRREMGVVQINEWNMERVMEALENQCHEKMTAVMKTEQGMGIEYDEDIVCDVCCSPDSEDTNEMVFCDGCDVCIHQACYGIQSIPEGSWLCRTCALGIKPNCMLCPKPGGAMKSTRSGTKWAHVSCALWIPEVSIGIPEKMEPITKISNIPPSRWALVCCLCKERVGACIQCSVKTCKTAFHVTCGFSNGLEMKTVLDETDEGDGVKLKAYCPKHTKKRERGHSESDSDSPRKDSPPTPKKEMTQQERDNLRAEKLKSLEEDFHSLVDIPEVCETLQLDIETVDLIYLYWKLKRKCNWDKPLLTPKTEEADMLERQQEDSLVARMKMFVHLRQDLERVRNLCYMIGKREKTKRHFFRSKEYVFTSMVRVLLDKTLHLSNADVDDIVHNYHFDSIYDDYGVSVPNLPPEPNQDEEHLDELDLKEEKVNSVWDEDKLKALERQQGAQGATEGAAEEKPAEEPSVVEEEEEEEDPNEALPPGERWSGEFVRSGFFMRRRHKKWMKGNMQGKGKKRKLPPVLSSPETSAPAMCVKPEKIVIEDDNVFTSNDESDEDKEKLAAVVKAIVDKSDDDSDLPQPVFPKLVVKSPKTKPFALRHHRQRKRHRGRKPWHMKEAYEKNIQLSSSEDEDMKVKPIVERKKESCVVEKESAAEGEVVVDVVGVEEPLTSQQHMIVDVEGDGGDTEKDMLLSSLMMRSHRHGKDSGSTPADKSKKRKRERTVQKLFDFGGKESEHAKSSQSSERTKPVNENAEHVTHSDNTQTQQKSTLNKPLDNLKKTENVEEKEESRTSISKPNPCESSVKSDSSPSKGEHRKSGHRRKSSKSKSKSGSGELKDAHGDKACAEATKRTGDESQIKADKSEEKRKEKESRHKHHESSSASRRSKRERHKSRHSDKHSSSPSKLAHTSSACDGLDSNQSELQKKLGHSEESIPVDDSSVPKLTGKDHIDSDVPRSAHKMKDSKEEMRKRDVLSESMGQMLLSSDVKDDDRQRTRKSRELSDKVKHKARETADPFKSAVTTARRKSSSSGHSNIFERMELSTGAASSGHSSERSNIFESMERHCREGSLDLGLKTKGVELSEPLKSHPSIDWPSKVEFHFGDEPTKLPQSSDNWFVGSRSSATVQETVKPSGSSNSSSLNNFATTDHEKADVCQASKSVVESCELQGEWISAIDEDAGKASGPCSPPCDKAVCLPSGDGPCALQEGGSSPASQDPCLQHEDELLSGGDAPCLSKAEVAETPVEPVSCSPSHTAPCLPDQTVLSVPSEILPSIVSEEAPCLPSENVPSVSGEDDSCLLTENAPPMPGEEVSCLSSEQVPPHQSEDVNEDDVNENDDNLLPRLPDDENGVCVTDKEKMSTEGSVEVESEQVNGVQNSLLVSTGEMSESDLQLQADRVVEDAETDLQVEKKVDNSTESDLQAETGGVNVVEKVDTDPNSIHAQAAENQNSSRVLENLGNSNAVKYSALVEDVKPISIPNTADKSNGMEMSDTLPQPSHDLLKTEPSEFGSRQHSKRSCKVEDKNNVKKVDPLHIKNIGQTDVNRRFNVVKPIEKSRRKNSVHAEEEVEFLSLSESRVLNRRRSSHLARLKLSKVLAAPDSSSDDDFEPTQPVMTTFSRRQKPRHNKKVEVKRRGRNMSSEDMSEGEDSEEEDDVERHRRKRRMSHHRENRDKSLQVDVVPKSVTRTCVDNLQPELSKLLKPADLIVGEDLVRRVEDRVLRRFRPNHHYSCVNGTLEDRQREQKVTQVGRDSKRKSKLITKDSNKWLRSSGDGETPLTKSASKTRVLNEITPERSGNFQTCLFGAHYTPRSSLSGYKIPKKSCSQAAASALSPQTVAPPPTVSFSDSADSRSFKSVAAPGDPSGQAEGTQHTVRKMGVVSEGAGNTEATSSLTSDQCEGHPLTWNDYRDYRSGSPASEVSVVAVVARRSDSRESTPRRCTRSQLADEPVENSPSPHGVGTHGSSRMKLRAGWLKASNFPS